MKTALLVAAATLALGTAAMAQEHDHSAHAQDQGAQASQGADGHAAHGEGHGSHGSHGSQGEGHAAHGEGHGDHGSQGEGHAAHGEGHGDHAAHSSSGEGHDPAHLTGAMHAEHTLRDTIALMQAGTPDYDRMVPELADAVRAQEATMTPSLAALGELQSLEHAGEPAAGAHQFTATFAGGQTLTWTISVNEENKIAGLLVQ